MRFRSLWIGLFLALCAMQAHAWLHTDHDASAADPACLSCKLQADWGGALPLAASLILLSPARPVSQILDQPSGPRFALWPLPLVRGPPGPL